MKKISSLTYKIASYTEVPNFNMDECIDWAVEMISLGYDSQSLYILAGLSKPTNYFETVEYLKATFEELNLNFKTGADGVVSYSSYYIEQISKGINVKENLRIIYRYCQEKDYEKPIYDFFLLHWAWGDLDYGNDYQSYWPDATKSNIENITISTAQNWVKENKNKYAQKIEG